VSPVKPVIDARVRFGNSPVLISVRHRVQWRTAVLCLILSKCHSQRARLDHLHLLNWSLETDGTRGLLKVWLSGARPMDRATVRIDPELNITITLARGLNLVDVLPSKKVALTEMGNALVQELNARDDVLTVEKAYLAGLGPLTESRLDKILGALAA
jgi:hypothetical protein